MISPFASRRKVTHPGRLPALRAATWPALAYLIATTQIPFLFTIYFSMHAWNLLYPMRPFRFVGLRNFVDIGTDPTFRIAIINTAIFTLVPAILTTLIGLGLALLLNALRVGRGLAYSMLFAPFLIMETVNPIIWKNMILNPVYGLLSFILTSLDLPAVDLLAAAPRIGIIVMIVWQWSPFMMLVLLAGLQTVLQETRDAARVDGAGAWHEFYHVVLPHLVPYLTVGMLVEAILILPVFGPIYVGTYGGPGNQTTNLMFLVYRILTEQYDVGRAAAAGIVTALMTTLVATVLLTYSRPYMERD
jgi:sorbitol/mannitol transport system permease protein